VLYGVRLDSIGRWLGMTGLLIVGLLPFVALGIAVGHLLTIDSMGPAVGGGHEHQLGAELPAERARQRGHRGRARRAVQLVPPHTVHAGNQIGLVLGEPPREPVQAAHRSTIATIWRSRVSSGAGSVIPRTTRVVAQRPSGIRGQRRSSPVRTPAVGTP